MEDQILFHLKETHIYVDYTSGKAKMIRINHVALSIPEEHQHKLCVDRGVVYVPIMGSSSEKILAAVQETPAELSNNPYIKLVEINKEE